MLFFDVEKQRLELKLFFLKLVVLEVEFSLVEIFSFRTPLEMTAREILGRIIVNSTLEKISNHGVLNYSREGRER